MQQIQRHCGAVSTIFKTVSFHLWLKSALYLGGITLHLLVLRTDQQLA